MRISKIMLLLMCKKKKERNTMEMIVIFMEICLTTVTIMRLTL